MTILPACRMQLVKENIALNTGTSHLPPPGVWRPTMQSWNPSPTCCRLLQQSIACHKLPNVTARMHNSVAESWLLCGEGGKTEPLSIRSLVAKETNAPNTCYTTLIMRVVFFSSSSQLWFCLFSSPHSAVYIKLLS